MGLPLPVMIGLGALGGAATSKNPLKGALLGGTLGGIGGMFAPAVGGTAAGATAADVAAGVAPFEGAVFNPATGTWLNPAYYMGASTPLATYTGGEGLLSNALGNISASIPSSVKDYLTPQNMIGVANMMTPNQAPLQNIGGSAQARPGQAPTFTPFQTGEVLSPWKKRGQA